MEKINLIKIGKRLDVIFYTGAIRAECLLDNCDYPTYEPGTNIIKGYQRLQKDSNVNAVAERTLSYADDFDSFIDNINGNIRDASVHEMCVKPIDKKNVDDGDMYVFEYEPDMLKLPEIWTVDGQTRVKGLAKARAIAQGEKNYELVKDINNKRLGINLTFTTDVYKECFIFYLLNHYSTNIPPEGALRMMYDGFKSGEVDFRNEITNTRSRTQFHDIQAMEVTERLSQNSAIWDQSISDFNADSKANKISIKAMTNIIKPLFEKIQKYVDVCNLKQTPEHLTHQIFDAYWEGLAMWAPQMFDPKTKLEYGIMKSSQTEVMTKVLIKIFEEQESWKKLGTNIGSLTDPKTYFKLVDKAFSKKNLQDTNGGNNLVSGPDCWRVGKAGSMGKYTNSAAKRDMRDILFTNIKEELKKANSSII